MRDIQQHINGERNGEQAVGHGECGVTNGDLPLVEQLVRCIGDMPDCLAQHEVQDDDDSEQRELEVDAWIRIDLLVEVDAMIGMDQKLEVDSWFRMD